MTLEKNHPGLLLATSMQQEEPWNLGSDWVGGHIGQNERDAEQDHIDQIGQSQGKNPIRVKKKMLLRGS